MKKGRLMMVSGGYLYFMLYRPSCERKSGMPLSVDTPAPPKNTMRFDSLTHCLSFSFITSLPHLILTFREGYVQYRR